MYGILYSCYSAACWPISCLICRGRQTSPSPEAITPSSIDSLEDEEFSESKYIAYEDQKSHGSCVTENTLPKICINTSIDFDEENLNNNISSGSLLVSCQYSTQKKLVILTILEARDDSETGRQEGNQIQVRLALLENSPIRKHRTKILAGPCAKFSQTFTFSIEADDLFYAKLRFRLYRYKSSFKRSQFCGECYFPTADIDTKVGATQTTHRLLFQRNNNILKKKSPPSSETTPQLPANSVSASDLTDNTTMLRRHNSSSAGHNSTITTTTQNQNHINSGITPSRRNSTVDSSGRFCALPTENGQPEVLITLCYLDQSQKAVVTIEKASNLCHDCSDKVSETYIRVSLLSQFGEELAKHRSATVKSSSDANYECTAVFQIPRNELENTSVLIQVFRNIGMLRRRQQIGFVCIGENASSPDAQDHWNQMIQGLGTSVEKWHYLRRPDHEKINGVNK